MSRTDSWVVLITRWVKFHMIGLMGMVVDMSLRTFFKNGLGLEYRLATALAVEAAVLHNFCWHERYTWKDRKSLHYTDVLKRLLRFNLTTGLISLVGNLLIVSFLVGQFGMAYPVASLCAIAACSCLNFLASEVIVFRRTAHVHETHGD